MTRKAKADSVQVQLAPNKMIPFTDERIPYDDGVVWSPKFDGNRNFCRVGDHLTRNMLPQPNRNLPKYLKIMSDVCRRRSVCLDMELVIPTATHHGKHGSIFNSHENEIPKGTEAHVFDAVKIEDWNAHSITTPFRHRIEIYQSIVKEIRGEGARFVHAVPQRPVRDAKHAEECFLEAVKDGYEGMMLRALDGGYKQGRCGHKGAWLLKFKSEETLDGRIVEVIQMRKMKKGIERTRNAWGRLEAPTKNEDNFDVQESVGALLVEVEDDDGNITQSKVTFAEGWDMQKRKELWKRRKSIIGKMVEFKHFPVGAKDGIRSGRLVQFRPDKD